MEHREPDIDRSERTRSRTVRFVLSCTLLSASCATLAGCKSNQKYDLIEAELRTRNEEVRELRGSLEQSRVINRAYEQQLQSTGQAGPGCLTGQTRPSLAPGIFVKDIILGRGTGGYDEDNCPGDEALMVVVVPQDEDGSPVKVPAKLTVAAWQVDEQGLKTSIGQWDISAEKLRPQWKSGLFNNGYSVVLPWQTAPTTNRIRIAARLTTLDGRSFEADRDVSVRPLVSARSRDANPNLPPPVTGVAPTPSATVPGLQPPALVPGLPPPVYELPQPGTSELPPPKGLVP